jgi:hypothetical protein
MSVLLPKADIGQLRLRLRYHRRLLNGAAKLADRHLASKVHCVDDEIIGWLKVREQASFNFVSGRAQK